MTCWEPRIGTLRESFVSITRYPENLSPRGKATPTFLLLTGMYVALWFALIIYELICYDLRNL